MTRDLTDEELAKLDSMVREPVDFYHEYFAPELRLLLAEVRRHRAHKCERGGKCDQCGSETIPHRLCSECSQ